MKTENEVRRKLDELEGELQGNNSFHYERVLKAKVRMCDWFLS